MIKKIFISIIILLFATQLKAQLLIGIVPDSIACNASAVLRYSNTKLTINKVDDIELNVEYAITILNSSGDSHGNFVAFYDKFKTISDLECRLYNVLGKEVEKYKAKDFEDISLAAGYSVFEDSRGKILRPRFSKYPYTLVYEYTIKYKSSLHYPLWRPQKAMDVAVENATLTIEVPNSTPFRFIESGFADGNTSGTLQEGKKWEVNNLNAIDYEPLSPAYNQYTPEVRIAAVDFEMDDVRGNMETWQNFGNWINTLNSGRAVLPPETINEIKELTNNVESEREKAKLIYEYMQSKTRYVSIQVGIGGWQPMPAQLVDDVGYGDCKALSNYTMALLGAAGIKSHYTLVRAGRNAPDVNADFPSSYFNHAILCVPFQNDTVWLECTDQRQPFGYLGYFTDNRNVLIIDENGGKIARTKTYLKNENRLNTKANIEIFDDGKARGTISKFYSGQIFEAVNDVLPLETEEQKKWLYKNNRFENYTINNFAIDTHKDIVPNSTIEQEVELKKYGSTSANRMFMIPNIASRDDYVPKKLKERKNDIQLRYSYTQTDTVVFTIPENYSIEYHIKPVELKTVFGEYTAKSYQEDSRLIYIRTQTQFAGLYDKSKYDDLRDYFGKIAKSDKQKIVLKAKQ